MTTLPSGRLRLAFVLAAALSLGVLPAACAREGAREGAPPPAAAAPSPLGDAAAGLEPAERQAIAAMLGLERSADGVLVDATCGQPVHLEEVAVRDLDGDGSAEILVFGGNTCTSGGAGRSLALFVRDAGGAYRATLNFPAASYELLPRPSGLPDVRLTGLRPCAAVWRWTGSAYEHLRNEELQPAGCEG